MRAKTIALFLAFIFIISMFAACKKDSPTNTQPPDTKDVRQETDFPSATTSLDVTEPIEPPTMPDGPDVKEESEYAYLDYNKSLKNDVPEIIPGQTFMATDIDARYLVTIKEPIGTTFRPMLSDYMMGSLDSFFGITDDIDKIILHEFQDTLSFLYVASKDEVYDVRVTTSYNLVGEDEIARVGDAVMYEKIMDSNGEESLLFLTKTEDERFAIIPFCDDSDIYDDGLYHGDVLVIRIRAHGEKADAVRAFKDLFEFSVLHNEDKYNTDVSYTLDGKEVDTSSAVTPQKVSESVLKQFNLHFPEGAKDHRIYFNELSYTMDGIEYVLNASLCGHTYHQLHENTAASRDHGEEGVLFAMTGRWPSVALETNIQNVPFLNTNLSNNEHMYYCIELSTNSFPSEVPEEMIDFFITTHMETAE